MKSMTRWLAAAFVATLLVWAQVAYGQDEPAGLRNNNPGNIVCDRKRQWWQGQTGCVDLKEGSFVTFDTPESGLRALYLLLSRYHEEYGLDTIDKIMSRWSSNPEAGEIVAKIIRDMGPANAGITKDTGFWGTADQYISMGYAITVLENGYNPYEYAFHWEALLKARTAWLKQMEVIDQ